MQMRQMGPDEPMVSAFGIRAMSFSVFYGPSTGDNSHTLMDAAIEASVTHLETANLHGMGRSETAIGIYLLRHPGLRYAACWPRRRPNLRFI